MRREGALLQLATTCENWLALPAAEPSSVKRVLGMNTYDREDGCNSTPRHLEGGGRQNNSLPGFNG